MIQVTTNLELRGCESLERVDSFMQNQMAFILENCGIRHHIIPGFC